MATQSRRVVIVGAGVIGVTSAYYLAEAGFEVSVIERRPGPALETSFANAGEISPGYASPWASPDVPRKIPAWLLMEHAPLILRPRLDGAMLCWILQMLRNCTSERYAINKARMVRLAEYSRDRLTMLREATGIAYDDRSRGTLQLFRKQAQLDAIARDIELLRRDGVPFEVLDRKGCIAAEPGLRHGSVEIVGGLRLPNDQTGDCFKFTNALAGLAQAKGVRFQYGVTASELICDGRRISGLRTDAGLFAADSFIISAGSYSPALVRPLGMKLPVYPVKGYSITVPIRDADRAPESTLLDESFKIAITRLGNRIRVGGMAEVSGFNVRLHEARRRTLVHSVQSLFPGAGDMEQVEFWAGLRPMTPDGTPVIGPTPIENLFLNTGHGTLGWTMACGSARVIADMVSGRSPDIEACDLGLARYRH